MSKTEIKCEQKCKLKYCLNNENELCSLIKPFAKLIKPDSIHCEFFEDDFEKSWKNYKERGGTIGALIRLKKKLPFDADISSKSKTNKKNNKKNKSEPETNNLDEII